MGYSGGSEIVTEVFKRFTITCKKCGSTNVVLDIERGWGGTDVTAGDPGEIALGCNDCKQNDYTFSVY